MGRHRSCSYKDAHLTPARTGCWLRDPPQLTQGKGQKLCQDCSGNPLYPHLQGFLKPAVPSVLSLRIPVFDFKKLNPPQFPRKLFLYHTFAPQWKRRALESLHCCQHRMQRWTQESRRQPQQPQTPQIVHPVSSDMSSSHPVGIPDSSASTQCSGAVNTRILLMQYFPSPLQQPLTIYLNLN